MATNATTWFYSVPEIGRPYLISERVNHTFWTNRMHGLHFNCTQAEAPFRLESEWNGTPVEIEFVPNQHFTLRMSVDSLPFIKGCSEVLGFPPSVSYKDGAAYVVEWWVKDGAKRVQEVREGRGYQHVKVYTR
jgi:hypothetical protein